MLMLAPLYNRFGPLGPQYLWHHLKLMVEPWVPKDLNVMRNLEMHKTDDADSEWPLLMMMADTKCQNQLMEVLCVDSVDCAWTTWWF